jgi:hypothetical protein
MQEIILSIDMLITNEAERKAFLNFFKDYPGNIFDVYYKVVENG